MLPVAGISADVAHDILTGLRAAAAAAAEQERERNGDGERRRPPTTKSSNSTSSSSNLAPERWLDALLLTQLAADALHRDAKRTRRALAFWTRAAAEGSGAGGRSNCCRLSSSSSHSARLLLRSGPREAFRGFGRGASRVSRRVSSLLFPATGEGEEEAEEAVEEEGGEGGGDGEIVLDDETEDPAAAVDAKTRELALLCAELDRALCRVHAAADLLTMETKKQKDKKKGGPSSSSSPSPAAVLATADAAAAACCRALCEALAAARAAPSRAQNGADYAALSRGTHGALSLVLAPTGGGGNANGGRERPSSAAAAAARSAAARPASAPLAPATPAPPSPSFPSKSPASSSEAAIEGAKEALGLCTLPARAFGKTRAPEALAAVTAPVVVRAGSSPAAAAVLPLPRGSSDFPPPLLSIVPLPERLRPPSWLQQRWLFVAAAAVGGAVAAALVARRCRFLGGDGSLENAVSKGFQNAAGALDAHVVEPLASLRAEMFSTLRDRRAIVTNEEFLAETKALERMLADFDRDVSSVSSPNSTSLGSASSSSPGASSSSSSSSASSSAAAPAAPGAAAAESSPLSMARLMRTYEDELRHPVKNIVSGQLARCLLIQLQKVKVDSASALLEMDQVLRANELSLAATAAVPALAVVYVLVLGVRKVFFSSNSSRRPLPDPRRAAAPLRSAFADAEDALVLAAEEEGGEDGEGEKELFEGKALFELGRALAAVDALLGLKQPRSPPPFFSFLPSPAARVVAEEPGEDDTAASAKALPNVVGSGVLGSSASAAWSAADAARCRAALVALARPSASAAARAEAAARLARSSALLK